MQDLFDEVIFILQRLSLASVVDLALVTLLIFAGLLFIRNTRAMVLLRGFLLLYVLISLFTAIFELPAFSWLVRNSVPAILVAIPVIFAPEIRSLLEQAGKRSRLMGIFAPQEERRPQGSLREELTDCAGQRAVPHEFVRAAHTLAGIARTVGVGSLAELSHALEKLLQTRHESVLPMRDADRQLAEAALGRLETMVDAVRAGTSRERSVVGEALGKWVLHGSEAELGLASMSVR